MVSVTTTRIEKFISITTLNVIAALIATALFVVTVLTGPIGWFIVVLAIIIGFLATLITVSIQMIDGDMAWWEGLFGYMPWAVVPGASLVTPWAIYVFPST